ncbi:MAG: [FeFe] hydrogenase H-cluster radical SAM maturase HydE [Bacteroidales bacterium]|jgi:biotin synthase|nr:[FeFe] hydrogenase H-cluster radical SAM maturase HydE [Bacteroidales bacterium]
MTLDNFNNDNLSRLLMSQGTELEELYRQAKQTKEQVVGNNVYYRGLIEYSNRCTKNCFYCGVRRGNKNVKRYTLTDDEVLEAAMLAHRNNFGSLVLQSGERNDKIFVEKIAFLLSQIRNATHGELHVTLSLGEQTAETLKLWRRNGAHRYLLRIETSNRELYQKMHPNDSLHNFDKRLDALKLLQDCDYQTGTGVMIGLPFQTISHLADDLLFIRNHNIDMVGMGPYIEHEETPLYKYRHLLLPADERFELSMKMVALLRIMMPDINIAATTAMQTLHPKGREKALTVGANVIMPNLTPLKYREGYQLYANKPNLHEETESHLANLKVSIESAGCKVAIGEWGDPLHYFNRQQNIKKE